MIFALLDRFKIPAESLDGKFLPVDFLPRPHAESSKNRNWRTPSFNRMQKEEAKHDARDGEETSVHRQAEYCAVRAMAEYGVQTCAFGHLRHRGLSGSKLFPFSHVGAEMLSKERYNKRF